jgi:HEAT repeat protein
MRLGTLIRVPVLLATVALLAVPLRAQDQTKRKSPETSGAGSTPSPLKAARAALAGFEKGDGDWKARMEALVRLAQIGPAAAPVLTEALQDGKPVTREFAAQALVLFADAAVQPALERALGDPKPGVRLYAIQALSMLGPLPRTKENERILNEDPTIFGVRPMMAAALERADRPNLAEVRKDLAKYDLRNLDSALIGQIAPDFTLTDYNGKTHRLSQIRGKTVVLRFILFDY